MTTELKHEWKRHLNKNSADWQGGMIAKKKQLIIRAVPSQRLRNYINSQQEVVKKLMMKDIFLIEAALSAKGIILSKDRRARDAFAVAANSLSFLSDIVWVDTVEHSKIIRAWLAEGAPEKDEFKLGYHP